MSQSIALLKRQIGGATDLQSVVRTMKAMAASNITQYENSVRALSDYSRTVELGLGVCIRAAQTAGVSSAALPNTGSDKAAAVVFGTDQGLVGQFNTIIADEALQTLADLPGKPMLWAVGERVHSRLTDADADSVGRFNVPNTVRAIAPLVGKILIDYEARTRQNPGTQLYLFHNRPTTGSLYEPVSQRLLPLDNAWRRQRSDIAWPTKNPPEVLGDPIQTMRKLTGEYLFVSLFRACAESLASENASRLAAMQRADKNIEELLLSLNASYCRQRQSSIDEELFDVVSGFEALEP
ncbi:F0F1 ATP synthase subunit gamma [Rosistilla oblonga]|uniref:F0F1 ATP synthase subunit gamma n=1 Tax=Rosistilla oblonga TaxID=2527990 RepID=UPI003A98127D